MLERVLSAVAGLGLTAVIAFPSPVSAATGRQVRVGVAPALPAGATLIGGVPAAHRLHLTVALRPVDAGSLRAYAAAVSRPGSPLFRHYLTPAQFARRFAPTQSEAASVTASLRAHGLVPGARLGNGLSIPILTTVGAAARAFGLGFAEVRLPSGRRAVVATTAPAMDRSVAGLVQSVVGLSGVEPPRPMRVTRAARAAAGLVRPHVATGGPQPCSDARSAAPGQSAYTADQIASAYEFPGLYRAGDEGQGVTVALYELEPDDPADIAAYQRCYGTHAQVGYVPVDGGAGTGAGSGEAAFDIEQVIGLAPKARLLVYQGPNSNSDSPGSGPYDTDAAIISQDRAQVISTSWGECEAIEGRTDAAAENVLFEEAAVQGQTLISASGDTGSEDCDGTSPVPDTQLAVDDPASQPFVTGVGGTTLSSLGPPPGEATWNNGGNATGLLGIQPGAGGGGLSSLWPMPAFQSGAPAGLHVLQSFSSSAPCQGGPSDCREVPDVAADADPDTGYLIYYNGSGDSLAGPSGWQGSGGTSGAAPLWAAVVALADGSRSCAGSPIGFADPALYRLGATGQGRYFNDITTGNNDFTGTSGGRFPAGPGYDLATGLGTPRAASLASALCQESLRLAAGPRWSFAGSRTSVRLRVSDAPGAGLRVSVSGLPRGLSVRIGSTRISGTPRRIGVFHVTVVASDRGGASRRSVFPWTITGRPRLTRAQLTGVARSRASLRIGVVAGRDEPPLRTLTIVLPSGLRVASLRALRVAGPGGRRLSYGASRAGNRLIVRLRSSSRTISLTLPGGLAAAGPLVAQAPAGRPLAIGLNVVDSESGRSALRARIRPAS